MELIKVAMFDTKPYDRSSFEEALVDEKLQNTFKIVYLEPKLSEDTVALATGCKAVCCFVSDDLSESILNKLNELKVELVVMRCAGFDRLDLATCKTLQLSTARVPAYSPRAVAEFAATLLMTLNRRVHKSFNRVRDGNFTLTGLVGMDLYGKTVGVIGTGRIGQCFIDIAIGFGCKLLCYDVYQSDAVKQKANTKYVELDELLAESDVISIHIPLLKETRYMINKQTLEKMKRGVILINTSRGALIDTKALIDSLVSGHVRSAGLDVYENESDYFFKDVSDTEITDETLARLTNMRNVLLTSHQAFLTEEALAAISNTTIKNLVEFFIENKRLDKMTNHISPVQIPAALTKTLSRRLSR